MLENMEIKQQLDNLLKEIKELKENQEILNEKVTKMQQTINCIESDIYFDEECDCEECCDCDCAEDNDDEDSCSGHCHGCSM